MVARVLVLLSILHTGCGSNGLVGGGDGGPPGQCPDPSTDPDGGVPIGDGGFAYAMWPDPTDGGASGGLSLVPAPSTPPGAPQYAALYPDTNAAPPPQLRAMAPQFQITAASAADMVVTIPLTSDYAGCTAALYLNPPQSSQWLRVGDFSTGVVSAVVHADTEPSHLLAGTCASECNGACPDLKNDDANCGACGNACPPAFFCVQGSCSGQVLGPVPPAAGVSVPVVAIDTDNVYFPTSVAGAGGAPTYSIARYPKIGGAMAVVVPDTAVPIYQLRVAGTSIYWSGGGGSQWGIGAQPVAGGTAYAIGGGAIAGFWNPFAVDGTYVYYGVSTMQYQGPGTIDRLAVAAMTTSGQSSLAQTTNPQPPLETDGAHLVWRDGASLRLLDLTTPGAMPVPLADLPGGPGWQGTIHLDGSFVYGTTFDGIGAGAATLARAPLDGGPPEVLAQAMELDHADFAVHNGTLAWSDAYGAGALFAKLPGRAPIRLTQGRATGAVALDDQNVYVVGSSTVWRIALPK